MKLTMLALIAPAMTAAAMSLPATGHADNYQFQSPSGNIT